MLHEAKIQTAIERIVMFCPEEGYWAAISGGVDSGVVYDLLIRSGVKFDAHFNKTTVDPKQVIDHLRDNYPDVKIEKPEITMWRLIVEKLFPPTRKIRYCCEYLKERGGYDRRVVTGIRKDESSARSRRNYVETCYKHRLKTFLHPIFDWSRAEVWEYTRSRGLPVCSLYQCQDRIGCVMCPCASVKKRLAEAARFPGFYRAYLRAFDKMVERRRELGKKTSWKNGREVMKWWLSA